MLIQSDGFRIGSFEVPAFTLNRGEMVRFWVEMISQPKAETDVSWVPVKLIDVIRTNELYKEELRNCPLQVETSYCEALKSPSLGELLQSRSNLNSAAIKHKLSFFALKPYYKVRDLGFAHQKVFAIICEFQSFSIVTFDYYGLAQDSEEQLTTYVKSELKTGKSAICFNSLNYKPEIPDSDRIKNLDIRRREKADTFNI
jgi:hypothetical protein